MANILGRSEEEEEKPKGKCKCSLSSRHVECKEHGY
tara:strand:+ start:14286 stop:14393 length:108 start_codon:yes stop_codon:yes gene_type:complete